MKLLTLIFLLNLCKITIISGNSTNEELTLRQNAFSDIFQIFFTEKKKSIDVIIYGNPTAGTDKILSFIQGNFPSRVKLVKEVNENAKLVVQGQTMIISQSTDDILNFFSKQTEKSKFYMENKILIFAENLEMNKFDVQVPMFRMGNLIEHSYFIVENKNEIQLQTFEWWTEEACNVTQLITLNSYNKKSMSWQKPLKIPQKFENFHNCSFVTVTSMHRTTIIDLPLEVNNALMDSDYFNHRLQWKQLLDELIMDIFAKKGNYTVIPALFKNDPGLQIYQITETFTEKEDFYSGQTFLPYYESCSKMMIPVAGIYSNYEKMLFPFDKITWILLIITFGIAILSINILNLLPLKHQQLIFGDKIRSSHIDVLAIFFGIPQFHVPRTTFSRIVLVNFLMFCLIIRTAYQGKINIDFEVQNNLNFIKIRCFLRVFLYGHYETNSRETFRVEKIWIHLVHRR